MLHNGAYRNIVRRNWLAESADYLVWRSPPSIPEPNAFSENTCVVTQGELFYPDGNPDQVSVWDHNHYYRTDGQELLFIDDSLAEWRARGLDRNSTVGTAAPPLSPQAAKIVRDAGLYGERAWTAAPAKVALDPVTLPPALTHSGPQLIDDDFETTPVGQPPRGAAVNLGPIAGGRIEITDEQAHSGRHSLMVVDAPGLKNIWDPHLFYEPRLRHGTAHLRFALRLTDKAIAQCEWRTGGYPYKTGPSITFDQNCKLTAGGRELLTVPRDAWLLVDMRCRLGAEADGAWRLEVGLPDGSTKVFDDLKCDPAFRRLGWLGFVSLADWSTKFYLDDLKLEVLP
jgi:hypothetical protein